MKKKIQLLLTTTLTITVIMKTKLNQEKELLIESWSCTQVYQLISETNLLEVRMEENYDFVYYSTRRNNVE